MEPQYADQKTEDSNSKHIRIYGLVAIIIGAIMLWVFIFNPISMAENGAEDITIYRKLAMIGMAICGFGFLMAILGENVIKMLPDTDANLSDIPLICWVTILSMSGVMIYGWWWFESQLKQLGY